jgi:DtxR family Mn-dependent transcriptional regulator
MTSQQAGRGAAHQRAGCAPAEGKEGADRYRIDELLEALYYFREEGEDAREETLAKRLDDADPLSLLAVALQEDLLTKSAVGVLSLSALGDARATGIVRRNRLAEVLFSQVLEVPEHEVEPNACEMEHILSTGVADSVCSFLGHPPRCPHGRAIPPGECCKTFTKSVKPIVIPMAELDVGKKGVVVFISSKREGLLARLGDLGVAPGATARLLQRYPSYVVQVNETSLALEEKIAREIYVRREV